jgi:hypothetical protein
MLRPIPLVITPAQNAKDKVKAGLGGLLRRP